jgi:hypothetical protein
MKTKSVKKNTKVIDKYMEDGGFFEDDEFWEELRGIKRKKMEDEVEEEEEKKKMKEQMQKQMEEMEKEMEVKEEKNENFDDKCKRRRERDEDTKEHGLYKQNPVNKRFENM